MTLKPLSSKSQIGKHCLTSIRLEQQIKFKFVKGSRGCIFSHVRPFYERAVSDLDRSMYRSLWIYVAHSSFTEGSHTTKNMASGLSVQCFGAIFRSRDLDSLTGTGLEVTCPLGSGTNHIFLVIYFVDLLSFRYELDFKLFFIVQLLFSDAHDRQ